MKEARKRNSISMNEVLILCIYEDAVVLLLLILV